MTVKKSYTSGHFELLIDGHSSSAYLKSVDGGNWKSSSISEGVGPEINKINHRGVLEVEPFTMDMGIAGCQDILKWIQNSWNKKYERRSGSVRHADFNLQTTFEHEFFHALITEVTFPSLDGASKEAGYLKIKIHPETVNTKFESGQHVSGNMSPMQKAWIPSGFAFSIDGIGGMEYTNKIESFTIKQGVKTHYVGDDRYPQIEPTKIEYPNIVGTMAMEYSGALHKWWTDHTKRVSADDKSLQKHAEIRFLGPTREVNKPLFTIDLYNCNIINFTPVASTANTEAIKRVKFELKVESMKLDVGGKGFTTAFS